MKIQKKTLVKVLLHGAIVKSIFVTRSSNTSLYVKLSKIPDSDVVMLEDIRGHRYKRAMPINPETDFSYFLII